MSNKAFIEYAFEVLSQSKKPLAFNELFKKTLTLSGLKLGEEETYAKMASLYTELSEDSRFALLDKKWDLSDRHSFSELHENDVDIDEEEDEEEMDEEEKKYLREESGEDAEEDDESESDDIDFDKKNEDEDDEEDFD